MSETTPETMRQITVVTGKQTFFKGIDRVKYEGPGSDNILSFKYYDENRLVGGKTMQEHLRFAVAYWHSICGTGQDMFGGETKDWAWLAASDPLQKARDKM